MTYVFEPPIASGIAVAGSTALFPARRIYCIGRNGRGITCRFEIEGLGLATFSYQKD